MIPPVSFFLGNVPCHILHALDIYNAVGGEFVVLSRESADYCAKQGVRVTQLDEYPEGKYDYDRSRIARTIEHLEARAGVVLFFNAYSIMAELPTVPKVMLFHGNSTKDYLNPFRIAMIGHCDYIVTHGPFKEERLRRAGIDPRKFLRIATIRCDRIIRSAGTVAGQQRFFELAGTEPRPIVSYLPTWWDPGSARHVGKEIVRWMPEDFLLVFRPHPQTPADLIREYLEIIARKRNVVYLPEHRFPDISLMDLYLASDAFIGDISSTVVDALLTDKPFLFAHDNRGAFSWTGNPVVLLKRLATWAALRKEDPFLHYRDLYEPLWEVVSYAPRIDLRNARRIGTLVAEALSRGIDRQRWDVVKRRMFHNTDGRALADFLHFLEGLGR